MPAPDHDDSQLQKAIALSLKDIQPSPAPDDDRKERDVIVLSDNDGDNEVDLDEPLLRRPRVPQQAMHFRPDPEESLPSTDGRPRKDGAPAPATTPNGILGLFDRKIMEEERLSRAKKRKAPSISPPLPPLNRQLANSSLRSKKPVSSTLGQVDFDLRPSKRVTAPSVSDSNLRIPGVHGSRSVSPSLSQVPRKALPNVLSFNEHRDLLKSGVHFPEGVVKKTWAQGYPRENDIKIEEVLQKNDLDLAVLSSFQWDTDWIMGKLDLAKTRIVCVVQAESEEEKSRMRGNVPPNIRFCFPSMAGQTKCMHSKLQLLSHPTHMRIVVPSANLVPYDWGEQGGIMENSVFLIDLPRLLSSDTETVDTFLPFHRSLRYFLKAMGIEQSIIDSLSLFDFRHTANFAFVHSIGGSHTGSDWKLTGYSGLGSAVKELGLATRELLDIDFVSASVGSLNNGFIASMYLAAQGDDGLSEYNWRVNKQLKSKTAIGQANRGKEETKILENVENHFRIYFPTRDTVTSSKGGRGSGGTICFQSRWYESPTFPRNLMRDCESRRPGLLMHNKILFVRPHRPLRGSENTHSRGWAYMGSANLSESAWGRLVMDRNSKSPKMNCRNWECGVIVPIPLAQSELTRSAGGVLVNPDNDLGSLPGIEIFEGIVPVPMVVPGAKYGSKRPWFNTEA